MSTLEKQYSALVERILSEGCLKQARNSDTLALFGTSITFSSGLSKGLFPLICGRKIFYKGVFGEMAAMLKGPKHVSDFEREGCNYWKQWAAADGSLVLDYGNAWRDFNGVDQLRLVIDALKHDPHSRRILISGWRPDQLPELSLPCCHMLYQWFVNTSNNTLEMIWYQRSADLMVGVPSNLILAATWNTLIANEVGLTPGKIRWVFGDTHIYKDHIKTAGEYLRASKSVVGIPKYTIDPSATVDNFNKDMIQIHDYAPRSLLNFEVFK